METQSNTFVEELFKDLMGLKNKVDKMENTVREIKDPSNGEKLNLCKTVLDGILPRLQTISWQMDTTINEKKIEAVLFA